MSEPQGENDESRKHHPDCPVNYFSDYPERCRCVFMAALDAKPQSEAAQMWECGPHANAWNGHDARCRRVVLPPDRQ
jgi:hypothetical protein